MIREPTLFVLAALARTPLHGYAIIGAVAELSEGRVTLRAGTLYAALDRLVREGALEVDAEEIVDGRLRRRYRITAAGQATAARERGSARGQRGRRPCSARPDE